MSILIESAGKESSIIKDLSLKEENEIIEHVKAVNHIQEAVSYFNHLQLEYKEFLEWPEESNSYKKERKVINYLSAFGEFINKWQKTVNRKNKNGLEEIYNFWDIERRKPYENFFEYRFITNLRHFTQHGGFPFTRVVTSNEDNSIYMNIEDFLNEDTGMKSVLKKDLKDLKEMNVEEVSVDKAIEKVHTEAVTLHNKITSKVWEVENKNDELLKSAIWIMNFQKKYQKRTDSKLLISDKSPVESSLMGKNTEIQITEIPWNYAEFIVRSAQLKFELKGKEFRNSTILPYQDEEIVYRGKKTGESRGINWKMALEGENFEQKKYYALYVPEILNKRESKSIKNKFLEDMQSFLNET